MIEFTKEELDAVHELLYDTVYYGPDEIVYGDGEEALSLGSALAKFDKERKV